MNANEITFGIEIECYAPGIICGGYHVGRQIPGFPMGWNAQHDGSLSAGGTEIVSPVLKGTDGLLQVVQVVNKLNEMGARVDNHCGFHVHVGHDANMENLGRLITLVANFEKAIFASTGTHSRESSHYCAGIQARREQINLNARTLAHVGHYAQNRYHVLNVTNLLTGSKPTVEFRAFAGTLNLTKIVSYIRMCLAFVERAHETARKTNWTPKTPSATSPIHRDGIGQTELTRMFYQFGWTKGRTNRVYGNVEAAGAPELQACKKELIRLARKYDSRPA